MRGLKTNNLSPITRRRLRNFKANRRGYWSTWIFLVLLVLTLPAEFAGVATPTAGIAGLGPVPPGVVLPGLSAGRTYTMWPVTPNLLLTSSGVTVAGKIGRAHV